MQAEGTHPAPCARHCESTAFQIEIRRLTSENAALRAEITRLKSAPSVRICGRTLGAPVRIGPTNADFYGIRLETDAEFAAWGRTVTESES